jgi:hypothetical protein
MVGGFLIGALLAGGAGGWMWWQADQKRQQAEAAERQQAEAARQKAAEALRESERLAEALAREKALQNLKQIKLAPHGSDGVDPKLAAGLPPAPGGFPFAILPYIEQTNLYNVQQRMPRAEGSEAPPGKMPRVDEP